MEPNENSKSYFNKAKFYKQLKEDTEKLINLLGEADKIKAQIELQASVRIKSYESEKVHELIDECEYNYLLAQVRAFKEKITEANKHLSIPNIHPIATTITKTIANIDTDTYEQLLSEIDALNSDKEKYNNYKKLQDNLKQHLPTLVNEILENTFVFSNFRQLENAIYFKHASAEITNLLAEDYETKLTYKLSEQERHEEKLISLIGSMKAWFYLIERLSKDVSLKQHLQKWVLAVKKIPKTATA
ncbi:MAG: hypothetical protein WKG06_24815 [Segetibacter sp.]